jgi:dTDP-4-dehydrorhamnose reductase
LDKRNLKDILLSLKPKAVINTIAFNDVDKAEEEHAEAMMLNAHLPEYLSGICRLLDSHFITYGTDYIFDGKTGQYKEESLPNPINYYGKSKLTGENMTRVTWGKSTVIRANIVHGPNPYGYTDFVKWVEGELRTGNSINIIEGQSGNPSFTGDIAHVTYKTILNKHYGILHTGSSDYLNRYQMALIVADVYGYDSKLINPIEPKALKQKAKRPDKGGLNLFATETKLDFKFASFRDGVESTKHSEKYQ